MARMATGRARMVSAVGLGVGVGVGVGEKSRGLRR
jgi:hypothetical protein